MTRIFFPSQSIYLVCACASLCPSGFSGLASLVNVHLSELFRVGRVVFPYEDVEFLLAHCGIFFFYSLGRMNLPYDGTTCFRISHLKSRELCRDSPQVEPSSLLKADLDLIRPPSRLHIEPCGRLPRSYPGRVVRCSWLFEGQQCLSFMPRVTGLLST